MAFKFEDLVSLIDNDLFEMRGILPRDFRVVRASVVDLHRRLKALETRREKDIEGH